MNNTTIAILAAIVVAAVVLGPVIAGDGRPKNGAGKCAVLMHFDKKTKTCRWKY